VWLRPSKDPSSTDKVTVPMRSIVRLVCWSCVAAFGRLSWCGEFCEAGEGQGRTGRGWRGGRRASTRLFAPSERGGNAAAGK